jgi:hypothetical protein
MQRDTARSAASSPPSLRARTAPPTRKSSPPRSCFAWRTSGSSSRRRLHQRPRMEVVSLSSHLVESRGELLWAFVQLDRCDYIDRRGDVGTINDLASSPSVSVYVLAEKEEGGEEVEWVKRDGWRLADRVMFLGRPAGSFAVERVRHFDDKRRGLRRAQEEVTCYVQVRPNYRGSCLKNGLMWAARGSRLKSPLLILAIICHVISNLGSFFLHKCAWPEYLFVNAKPRKLPLFNL